jgi:hypothetical protein
VFLNTFLSMKLYVPLSLYECGFQSPPQYLYLNLFMCHNELVTFSFSPFFSKYVSVLLYVCHFLVLSFSLSICLGSSIPTFYPISLFQCLCFLISLLSLCVYVKSFTFSLYLFFLSFYVIFLSLSAFLNLKSFLPSQNRFFSSSSSTVLEAKQSS